MQIVPRATELRTSGRPVCLAIGFFDGVHLGHQQIIRQTISDARQRDALALVVSFDAHPQSIVAPQRAPALIYSLSQKIRTIDGTGADALLLIHFDRAFSQQSGEAFIRNLAQDLGQLRSICVGNNFVFGHKRAGNVALLKNLGEELKFTVHGMPAVSLGGRIVSSTRIREQIRAGDLDGASQMLGRAYSVSGPVIRGDQLGHQLGFPTANVDVSGLLLPPNGVYRARALVRGQHYRAMVNIGLRPTLNRPEPQLRVEAHLLDFAEDIYGAELELIFMNRVRDERRFASLDELKAQIQRDIDAARQS